MKNKLSYLLSFAIMIVLFLLIVYVGFEISIRSVIVKHNIESVDYYDKAYENIRKEISNYVVNEDILKDYLGFIDKEMIIEDVNLLIKRNIVDHKEDFYKIISLYDTNEEICELYANSINNIYKNNLFPSKEYGLINVLKLRQDFIPFFVIFIVLLSTMNAILKCITDKKRFIDIALIGTSIMVFMLLIVRHYLKGLYYVNDYFTLLIKKIIDTNVYIDIFILVIILLAIMTYRKLSSKIVK